MSMMALENLRSMLCEELDKIAEKGSISGGDLETIHKLTDTVKNIDKIECLEDEGYSGSGEWDASGTYSRTGRGYSMEDGRGYGRGSSYASRRGMHYVRGHYSRAEGNAMMSDRIEEMMNSGNLSADEKNTLRRALGILQR